MSRRRILLGSLFHETHSFVDEETTLADFTIRKGADSRMKLNIGNFDFGGGVQYVSVWLYEADG